MSNKIILILGIIALLVGCQQAKSTEEPKVKKGMVKVSILYPNGEGKTFDMDYYTQKHMPMMANIFGDSLKLLTIEKGTGSGIPDTPTPFLAIGCFYFDKLSTYQNAVRANLDKIRADIPKYTNIQPVIQISEVQR